MKNAIRHTAKIARIADIRLVTTVVAALLASNIACTNALPTRPGASRAALDCDIGDDCTDAFSIRFPNSLSTKALTLNALATSSTAMSRMLAQPLSSMTYGPGGDDLLRDALLDPYAQQFMRYLAGCALLRGHVLDDGRGHVFTGEAGVCPEWETNGFPSDACKWRTSSCILARNNAFDKQVELYVLLTDDNQTGPFRLIKTETEAVDRDQAAPIESFARCEVVEQGALRNCGWEPDFVGTCTTGGVVQVGAGGVPPDSSCCGLPDCPRLGQTQQGRVVLRVYDELPGGNFPSARFLRASEGSCGGPEPAVSFPCPSTGLFSVMRGPYRTDSPGSGIVAATGVGSGIVVFPEQAWRLYPWMEGNFYGNLLDPLSLPDDLDIRVVDGRVVVIWRGTEVPREGVHIQGAIFKNMWACYADTWSDAMGYATQRVCATPGGAAENCAATVTGACGNYPFGRTNLCASQNPVTRAFYDCTDNNGQVWPVGSNVFLHRPCDLVDSQRYRQLCETRTQPPR